MPSNENELENILKTFHSKMGEARFSPTADIPHKSLQEAIKALIAWRDTHTRAEVVRNLREDRLANTKFWKGKITKLLDDEIQVYEQALKKGE